VRHILSDARCLFLWCPNVGIIGDSPVPKGLLPPAQELPPKRLTDEEVAVLVALGRDRDGNDMGFTVRLGLGKGLRWGDLCRTQRAHIHGEVLEVAIRKTKRLLRVPIAPDLLAEIRGRVGRLVPYNEADPSLFTRRARRASGVERFHPNQFEAHVRL